MATLVLSTALAETPINSIDSENVQRVALIREPARRIIELVSDAVFSVNLDGWTGVHMLQIVSSTKISAKLTSGDGVAQIIPVDPQLNLVSRSSPITAIDLVRVPGQAATVELIIGQKA
jgi:hypothetical protein